MLNDTTHRIRYGSVFVMGVAYSHVMYSWSYKCRRKQNWKHLVKQNLCETKLMQVLVLPGHVFSVNSHQVKMCKLWLSYAHSMAKQLNGMVKPPGMHIATRWKGWLPLRLSAICSQHFVSYSHSVWINPEILSSSFTEHIPCAHRMHCQRTAVCCTHWL